MAKRVAAGERLKTISASSWNNMQAAGEYFAGHLGLPAESGALLAQGGQTTIQIKNTTGVKLMPRQIVGLGDPARTPDSNLQSFLEDLVLQGATPSATLHRYQFAVTNQLLMPNEIGEAIFAGVAVCKVNVTEAVHPFATPKEGDCTQLASSFWGGARILYKPSGTGTKWAVVSLGSFAYVSYRCKTDAPHARNSNGTVSVWGNPSLAPGADSDTGANITNVINSYIDLEANKWCTVSWVNHGPELVAADCLPAD